LIKTSRPKNDEQIWSTSKLMAPYFLHLSCVATSVLRMRLLHAIAFSKKLLWFGSTNVISLKTQPYAVNARWKWLSQRTFKYKFGGLMRHYFKINFGKLELDNPWKVWVAEVYVKLKVSKLVTFFSFFFVLQAFSCIGI
jgi:hypothetical protein